MHLDALSPAPRTPDEQRPAHDGAARVETLPNAGDARAEDDVRPEAERLRQRIRDVEEECAALRRAWESNDSRRQVTLFVFWSALAWALWLHFESYKTSAFQGWNTGEWLINYEGGFVRRGLIGQGIYALARYVLHVNAAAIVFAIQIGLYLVAGALLTFLSLEKRSPWLPWMLLAPAGLLFAAMDPAGGYRKEELLFLPVLCLAVAASRRPTARRAWVVAGLTSYLVAIFSWEPSVFFLPFVLALLRPSLPPRLERRILSSVACVSVACTAAAVAFHGNSTTVSAIARSLPAVGVPKSAATGAVRALEGTFADSVRGTLMYSAKHDVVHYALSFLLCLFPFVASGWVRRHRSFFLLSFLWCLPQYLIACDYGRWIHAFMTCASIHWLALDEDRPVAQTVSRLPRWCFDVALLVWCTSWSMAHCDDGFRRDPNLLGQMQSLVTVR